jgi:hypothetical protein
LFHLKPQSEERADAPFDVVQGEARLVTVVGKIEYHRHAKELVAPLSDDSTPTSDDDLGEVIVKGYAIVAESH